jgi:hypothetical protein
MVVGKKSAGPLRAFLWGITIGRKFRSLHREDERKSNDGKWGNTLKGYLGKGLGQMFRFAGGEPQDKILEDEA